MLVLNKSIYIKDIDIYAGSPFKTQTNVQYYR